MKLVFTKLETDANEIGVTFNGTTWRPYNVADIKRTGYIEFTEEDCPDLTKIRVKGKFASFNSVEAVSDVELEQGLASRSLAESVQRIDSFISSTASETNKLADKGYVDDAIQTSTAVNRGAFDTYADLMEYSGTVTRNDYATVRDDETHDHEAWRYKWNDDNEEWTPEYRINESPMTQAQLASLNSGITAEKVEELENVHVTDTYSATSSDAMSGKAVSSAVSSAISSLTQATKLNITFSEGWSKEKDVLVVKLGELSLVYVYSIMFKTTVTVGTEYTVGTYNTADLPGHGKCICGAYSSGVISGILYFNKGTIKYKALANNQYITGQQGFIMY